MVDSSTSPTPTQSLSGKGDLDSKKGHSQLSVGTLPLTEEYPPEKPEDKDSPPSSSLGGLDTEAHDTDESITPSSSGSSDKTEETPTFPIGTRISTEYSPRDTSLKDPFSSFWSGNLVKLKNNTTLMIQIIIITASNTLCWIPSGIIYLISLFMKKYLIDMVTWATIAITPVNSIINPVVFIVTTIRKIMS